MIGTVNKMLFNGKKTERWLVVGLGNPGVQYEETRHNAGFMAIEKLALKQGTAFSKHKFDAEYGESEIGGEKVLLVKPLTYMNNSGSAVSAIAKFYKIPTEKIIILFDDISLPVGKIRIRRNGTHGGHNGIKDIIELLGTEDIKRVKIGVGEKPNREYDLKDWVLGKIPDSDHDLFEKALEKAVGAVEETVKRGIDSAMNRYNG